jgi:CRISPR/Cas system CSM-associated protein Csm4 (group 5 of RAMP superfamily)
MITEKRLEEALKFISETDEEHAKLSSGLEYLKDKSKRDKALNIINNDTDNSISLKEQRFYASDVYKQHIEEKAALAEKVGAMENKRAKEQLIIDVWRTLEASRRNNKI